MSNIINLYETWYQTYPFDEFRVMMRAIVELHMRNDNIEDLDKATEVLQFLKQKALEQDTDAVRIYELRKLLKTGMNWIARDKDDNAIHAFQSEPVKMNDIWVDSWGMAKEELVYDNKNYQQVKWSDETPTKITDLLEIYENLRCQ